MLGSPCKGDRFKGDIMHPAIQEVFQFFQYDHLPEHLQEISRECHDLAASMIAKGLEGRELTVGLRKLLEAKDCFVRAGLGFTPISRHIMFNRLMFFLFACLCVYPTRRQMTLMLSQARTRNQATSGAGKRLAKRTPSFSTLLSTFNIGNLCFRWSRKRIPSK